MLKSLEFTIDKPTVPGSYLVLSISKEIFIIEISQDNIQHIDEFINITHWLGPLSPSASIPPSVNTVFYISPSSKISP